MREPAVVPASAPDALDRAADALRAGSIVGIPTETVYGVAVLPDEAALASVVEAKVRPPEKGIAVLIDDPAQVGHLVGFPVEARRLAERYWPGPLTLVMELHPSVKLPTILTGGSRRLGVRLPDHAIPRALARRLGPIAVTSANRSGEPAALDAQALRDQLGDRIALIVDDGRVPGPGSPSTVVSVGVDGRIAILRPGAIDEDAILGVAHGVRP